MALLLCVHFPPEGVPLRQLQQSSQLRVVDNIEMAQAKLTLLYSGITTHRSTSGSRFISHFSVPSSSSLWALWSWSAALLYSCEVIRLSGRVNSHVGSSGASASLMSPECIAVVHHILCKNKHGGNQHCIMKIIEGHILTLCVLCI